MAKKSGIHIKKSKKGSLHTSLGVKKGNKIPASKLKIKSTDSPALKKKKQFAINAKKWKHQAGGDTDEAGNLIDQYNQQNDITSGFTGGPDSGLYANQGPGASAQQNGLIDPGQQPYSMGRANTNSSVDLQQYLKTPQGAANAKKYKRMGYDITGFDNTGKPQFSKTSKVVTGPNQGVQLFNGAASIATGIADIYNDKNQRADEYRKVVKNIAPKFMENMESEGLNNTPAFTMYGGRKKMGGPVAAGEPVGVVDFNPGSGLDDSMYEGFRHSGPYGQNMIYSGNLGRYSAGGQVSAEKAKEILRDGTAQGHALTDKQKRYFGWLAGGAKQAGGAVGYQNAPIYTNNPNDPALQNYNDSTSAYNQFYQNRAALVNLYNNGSETDIMKAQPSTDQISDGGNLGQTQFNGYENQLRPIPTKIKPSKTYPVGQRPRIAGQDFGTGFAPLDFIIGKDHQNLYATNEYKKPVQPIIYRKQAGGGIPPGPNPSPVNPQADQSDPNADYYKANATLQYFKTQLNNKLRDKDPKAYDQFQSGFGDINNQYKSGKLPAQQLIPTRQNYVQNSDYNVALSPEDVQGALGDQYQTYLNSLQTVNKYNVAKGQQPLYGDIEGNQDISKLNYGRRFASVTTNPTSDNTLKKANGTLQRRRTSYAYDPSSRQVNSSQVELDDQGNPIQPATGGSRQAGGYAVGQTVNLTTSQIKALKKQGYKIENA